MNSKILLCLFGIPAFLTSMLASIAIPAIATETVRPSASSTQVASCDLPLDSPQFRSSVNHRPRGILVASMAGLAGEDLLPNFTDAESDAAVSLFGCDCPNCIRALKQLQAQFSSQKVLGTNQGGHCWTSMQRRVSPQAVQDVLRALENPN
jgi:hypothetical protein